MPDIRQTQKRQTNRHVVIVISAQDWGTATDGWGGNSWQLIMASSPSWTAANAWGATSWPSHPGVATPAPATDVIVITEVRSTVSISSRARPIFGWGSTFRRPAWSGLGTPSLPSARALARPRIGPDRCGDIASSTGRHDDACSCRLHWHRRGAEDANRLHESSARSLLIYARGPIVVRLMLWGPNRSCGPGGFPQIRKRKLEQVSSRNEAEDVHQGPRGGGVWGPGSVP
jgi:hypothetical protein